MLQRFNVSLMPNGPMNPNAFLKGLRGRFENWKNEAKNALMNDLFLTKGAGPVTVMTDTLQRVFDFACSQVAQVSGPDIVSLIATL